VLELRSPSAAIREGFSGRTRPWTLSCAQVMMSFGYARARRGISDVEIFRRAARENRIVLTFDKDFGELARAISLPDTCGIVLFRLPMPSSGEVGTRLANLLGDRSDWVGHFSVVEPDRVRMRPLSRR
jgi:hypothetical protein